MSKKSPRTVSTLILRAAPVLTLVFSVGLVAAQESTSYKLEEHVYNAGGRPVGGQVATSMSFRTTLDALGEGLVGRNLSSASFRLDSGFVPAYLPPGEVSNLIFLADGQTLQWDPEPSMITYDLYRGVLSNLSGLSFGSCLQQGLAATSTSDPDFPATGEAYFYLVTAENRLAEEGTKGFQTSGGERQGSVCP
jgi:hypothetical protein